MLSSISFLDIAEIDIDSDVDECQVALSPSVVLNRLRYTSDESGNVTNNKRHGSRKR